MKNVIVLFTILLSGHFVAGQSATPNDMVWAELATADNSGKSASPQQCLAELHTWKIREAQDIQGQPTYWFQTLPTLELHNKLSLATYCLQNIHKAKQQPPAGTKEDFGYFKSQFLDTLLGRAEDVLIVHHLGVEYSLNKGDNQQ